MTRFNLSEWAITAPRARLFTILVLGAAGDVLLPQSRARRGPVLHHQGHDRECLVAGRDRVGDADPGRRPDREEAAGTALFRPRARPIRSRRVIVHPGDPERPTPPSRCKELWYQVRKKVGDIRGDLPAGIIGPVLQRRIRRRLFGALHAHRRRRSTTRGVESASPRTCASACCACRTSRRSISSASRTRRSSSSSATPSSRRSASRRSRSSTASPQQNAVVAGGSVDTTPDRVNLRVTGAFDRRRRGRAPCRSQPAAAAFRLGDIATVKRGYRGPAELPRPRRTATRRSASASRWQDGANIIDARRGR